MEYSVGHTGRVILLKLDEDEDILESLESLASKEKIETAIFFVIGSLKEGSLVSGAKTEELPVIPIWYHLGNNHEVLGIGNIVKLPAHIRAGLPGNVISFILCPFTPPIPLGRDGARSGQNGGSTQDPYACSPR